jgi:hypothetical protein
MIRFGLCLFGDDGDGGVGAPFEDAFMRMNGSLC